ncbi:hypothetical protein K1X76_02950 [bacterium]|nr:hypothetical protein [bacterium]
MRALLATFLLTGFLCAPLCQLQAKESWPNLRHREPISTESVPIIQAPPPEVAPAPVSTPAPQTPAPVSPVASEPAPVQAVTETKPAKQKNTNYKLDYKADLAFQNQHYFFSRSEHPINDQLNFEAEFGFLYDNRDNFLVNIKPLFYFDALDVNRMRYIPNEAYLKYYTNNIELSAGFQMVPWGVSRSFNPTDVMNRKDLERNYYRPERLGDPMVGFRYTNPQLGFLSQFGVDVYVLPVFMETPLPKFDSRFSLDNQAMGAAFTAFEEQEIAGYGRQIGAGLKVSGSIKATDISLHYYHGPERQPSFYLLLDNNLNLRIQPFYYTIDMIGFNVASVLGKFTLHAEAAYKITASNPEKPHQLPLANVSDAIPNNYFQFVPGVDYTFDGVFKTGTLILSAEYIGEDKHTNYFEEFRPLKNDIFLGTQFVLNDVRNTSFELGMMKDLSNEEMIVFFEAGTNVYKELRFTVGGSIINQDSDPDLPLSFFDNNTYVYSRLSYSFGGSLKKKK